MLVLNGYKGSSHEVVRRVVEQVFRMVMATKSKQTV